MDYILGPVTRSNNVFSWKVSVGDIFASEEGMYRYSPPFSYRGCSWHIRVLITPGTKKYSFAQLRRNDPKRGPDSTHVSFALGYRWKNGESVEDPPILNSKFGRYGADGQCYFLRREHSLNMAGSSMVTITCRFLEEDVAQLVDLTAARYLPVADTSEKKLKEAESTINKLRADIADLVNLEKLNKEIDQEVDALKKKFNEAQSTISKQKADIDVLIEEKKSIMKKIENLEKLNKEPELEALSADFRELLRSGNKSDVVLKVQGREFPAHSVVLEARSPVFRATFNHDSEEQKTGMVTIPDCDPESFPLFLNFLYSGRVGEMTVDIAQQLYATSDKYDVQDLKSICCDYLMHNLTSESVCDVAVLADLHFDDGLASAAQLYFNGNYIRILQTSEWTATLKNNPRISDKLLKEMAYAVGEKPAK